MSEVPSIHGGVSQRRHWEMHRLGVRQSARTVLPFIFDLVRPASVVDVGCGTAGWLAIAKECGATEVLGIDTPEMPPDVLEIPSEEFEGHDLRCPIDIRRRFDLVICVEVAEHLPESCAQTFVNTLTKLGNTILFSAAVPQQSGKGHINEQWLDYWIALFHAVGYGYVDCLRPRLWTEQAVYWWYAQNCIVLVERESAQRLGSFAHALDRPSMPLRRMHPFLRRDLARRRRNEAGDRGATPPSSSPTGV
jgi:SAM-dependent methyltransferase